MRGLSQNFILQGGRFLFTEGSVKAKDNLSFFMNFIFVRRIYMYNFNPELYFLLQKPFSYVLAVKTLLLGKLKQRIREFVPSINVIGIDALYDKANKEYAVFIDFKYAGNNTVQSTVTFV